MTYAIEGGGGSGTRFIGTALGGGGRGTRFMGTAAIEGGGGNGTRFIGTTPGGGGGNGTGLIGTAAMTLGGGGNGTRFIGTAALAVQANTTTNATRTIFKIPTDRESMGLSFPGVPTPRHKLLQM